MEVLSPDRLKLHGYPCTQKGSFQDADRWAILVHSYDNSGPWFYEEALAFYRQGFRFPLSGVRGYRKSQGTYMGMGRYDRLDVINWIYWIIRWDPRARIVFYGVSMSAAAVMMVVGGPLPDHVKTVTESCGHTSVWDALRYQLKVQFHLPVSPTFTCAGLMTHSRAGYGLKKADVPKGAFRTEPPILFIHGTEDRLIPFEICRMLYDACEGKEKYLAVEGAAHVRSATAGGPTYWDKVLQFINSYI